jgi:hypothetical protein
MDRHAELEVALDVEVRLAALEVSSPSLSELPIAPLRGVADLVRLELALPRFAAIHRSKRSKVLISGVRTLLALARARLRAELSVERSGSRPNHSRVHDTQPAA